jgi:hypothetical protein
MGFERPRPAPQKGRRGRLASLYSCSCCDLCRQTYQVPGGDGPTHGTDGPLKVSLAADGLLAPIDEQFLQVARALDQSRARESSGTDTNDLSTINVYTVGVLLFLSLILLHPSNAALMRLLRGSEMAQVRPRLPLMCWA